VVAPVAVDVAQQHRVVRHPESESRVIAVAAMGEIAKEETGTLDAEVVLPVAVEVAEQRRAARLQVELRLQLGLATVVQAVAAQRSVLAEPAGLVARGRKDEALDAHPAVNPCREEAPVRSARSLEAERVPLSIDDVARRQSAAARPAVGPDVQQARRPRQRPEEAAFRRGGERQRAERAAARAGTREAR